MRNPTDTSDNRFFDPVRGEPPEDCDVLGWSCTYDSCDLQEREKDDRNTEAMMMGAGETYGGHC